MKAVPFECRKLDAGGILAMAAIGGTGYLNYTNQPDIYCISRTDAADNFQQTLSGTYIDFAAPGYQVYSPTTGGAYAYGSGTSYATPPSELLLLSHPGRRPLS